MFAQRLLLSESLPVPLLGQPRCLLGQDSEGLWEAALAPVWASECWGGDRRAAASCLWA